MSHHGNSPYWYRVAGLCPRLVPHADLQRHTVRGKVWHVLHEAEQRARRFLDEVDLSSIGTVALDDEEQQVTAEMLEKEKSKLDSLGAVNLAAVEEYEEAVSE